MTSSSDQGYNWLTKTLRRDRIAKGTKKRYRTNEEIDAAEVRLIASTGEQVGIMPVKEALRRAREEDLDLVEVAPTAQPPVCRMLDFGKFMYDQAKKERKSKASKAAELKEVRFRPKTGQHDIDSKIHSVKKLLEGGDKVKVTVIFRGREIIHPQLGKEILEKVIESASDQGKVERSMMMEGHTMNVILSPIKQGRKQHAKA